MERTEKSERAWPFDCYPRVGGSNPRRTLIEMKSLAFCDYWQLRAEV